MKVTYSVLISLCIFFQFDVSHASNADSLYQQLDQVNHLHERADILYALSKVLMSKDWDQALAVAKEHKEVALQLKAHNRLAKGNFLIGYLYDTKDKHEEAVVHYFAAADLYRNLQDYKMVSYTLKNLGAIYYQTQSYETARNLYEECLMIDQELANLPSLAALQIRMGKVAAKLQDFEAATVFFDKALTIYAYTEQPSQQADTYNELGIIYDQQDDFDRALESYQEALELARQLPDQKRLKAKVLNNIGKAYQDQNLLVDSRRYFEEALRLQQELKVQSYVVTTLNNIGEICRQQGEDALALRYFRETIRQAGEDYVNNDVILAAASLHALYKEQGRYDSALYYSEIVAAHTMQVLAIKDNLERHNQRFRVDRLMQSYLTKKSKELQAVRQKNQWYAFGGSMVLMLLVCGYFYYKSRKRKLALHAFNKELASIASQLTDSIKQQSS